MVLGRDVTAVEPTTVVVDEEDDDELVVVASRVVGVGVDGVDACLAPPFEQDPSRARTVTRPVAASAALPRFPIAAMSGDLRLGGAE